jgi:hypothetical protein
MIWGEVSSWMTKKLEHKQEIERLAQQESFAAAQHARNLEAVKQQADLQVQVIRVQGEQALELLDAQTFGEGVKATALITGIRIIDGWNAAIRPGVATWAVVMLTLEAFAWIGGLSAGTKEVIFAALGLYLADRALARRGK